MHCPLLLGEGLPGEQSLLYIRGMLYYIMGFLVAKFSEDTVDAGKEHGMCFPKFRNSELPQ
jgi:hypothetical protein